MSATGLSTQNAPSPWVVLPHYFLGALMFLLASILIFFAADQVSVSYIGPKILSITHILVLGWVTTLIFGALYQLIPVVMEVKLYSEKLSYFSLTFLILGVLLLSWEFWYSYIGYSHIKYTGGTFVILAVLLFVINILKTASTTKNKTIENKFIAISVVWLFITVLLGMFILLNSVYGLVPRSNIELLKIHAIFGLVGWFMMLIIGVASTLMPMFFISHKLKKKYLNAAFFSINSGIILASIALYYSQSILIYIAVGAIFFGMLMFFKYNYDAYKKRLRKKLDIGMKLSVSAFIIFAISMLTGLLSALANDFFPFASHKVFLIYGISIILGFFTILILGQMYKTLPFIIWLKIYQDKVGKFKTPLPSEMYSEKIAKAHYYTIIVALAVIFIGILFSSPIIIQLASIFFAITALLFLYNTTIIIFHKEKLEPLKKIEFKK